MVKSTKDPASLAPQREFGARLRLVRLAIEELQGYNQGQVCARLDIADQSKWSHWEAGRQAMPTLAVIMFAQRFDVSGDYLVRGIKSNLRRDLADKIDEIERRLRQASA